MKAWVVTRGSRWEQRISYVVADDAGGLFSRGELGQTVHRWSATSRSAQAAAAPIGSSGPLGTYATSPYRPGQVHPRVWRPVNARLDPPVERVAATSTIQALAGLFVGFREVCRHVDAHPRNGRTFSHRLRELLVLACTEVEAASKAVLRANGYTKKAGHWNILDYRKLAGPMRLPEWELRLALHPLYPTVRPFKAWRRRDGMLRWYQAYNATKHDREEALQRATLSHVFEALAGALVLALAQFGPEALGFQVLWGHRTWPTSDPDFRLFEVMQRPFWKPNQLYVPPFPRGSWSEVPLVPRFVKPG